jgi:integrase/recombinase XerC
MPVFNSSLTQPFLDYLKFEKRYSVHTIISYKADLLDFHSFIDKKFGQLQISALNHGIIRSWLAFLKESGLSARSINRKISSLKSLFKFLLKTGIIELSPMTKVISPKVGKRLPQFVKEDDTQQLLSTVYTSAENWKSLNAKMIISLLYATGMRLSELINLKETQVDFSRSQIKVLGKGNKERIIPVGKNITIEIKEYLQLKRRDFEKADENLIVSEKGKKLYPRYVWSIVNQHLGKVSTLDKKSPHVLRHTFATHLMNNGANLNAVKELLGHSSLSATQVYTHNTIEKLKDVYKKAHPKS